MCTIVQDVDSCSTAKVSAKLLGPLSLMEDADSAELASAEAEIDYSVWLANDTTGQSTAAVSRTGGRALFKWTADDFSGTHP